MGCTKPVSSLTDNELLDLIEKYPTTSVFALEYNYRRLLKQKQGLNKNKILAQEKYESINLEMLI